MRFQRWGVTDSEAELEFGCDAIVPEPGIALWRGVSVDVPPAAVWPWVKMLRRAPYSYDLIDNLGRRSPRTLQALPEPQPGDRGMVVATVVAVVPGEEVTYRLGAAAMSYRLVAQGGSTRLLLKLVMPRSRLAPLVGLALPLGDLVMARKQLLTLKELAETEGGPAAA